MYFGLFGFVGELFGKHTLRETILVFTSFFFTLSISLQLFLFHQIQEKKIILVKVFFSFGEIVIFFFLFS